MSQETPKKYCEELRRDLGAMKGFVVDFDDQYPDAIKTRNFATIGNTTYSFGLLKKNIEETLFMVPAQKQIRRLVAMVGSEDDRKYFLPRFGISFEKRKIIYQEDLDLSRRPIKFLPKNLVVEGDFNINNTDISFLPKGLVVNGNFSFDKDDRYYIPEDIIIKGDCYLTFSDPNDPRRELMQRLKDKGQIGGKLSMLY